MRRRAVPPDRYRRITGFALAALVLIVVTGASVRLTDSGLGCSDWPNCEEGQLVAPLEYHALVEFVNRLVTGLVSVGVALAVLGSHRRSPRRRDLVLLSWGLVAGVAAQIVLGLFTVRLELAPPVVMAHFLLSMVLVANAVVLHERAGDHQRAPRRAAAPDLRRWGWALLAGAVATLVVGTLVTGAGPHGGDPGAERLPLLVREVTRVHSAFGLLTLAAGLAVVLRGWQRPDMARRAEWLLGALVGQILVGYLQYVNGVPELLVGLHVLGATIVWIAVLRVVLVLQATSTEPGAVPDHERPDPAAVESAQA